MTSRDVIRVLKGNGWIEVNRVGIHQQFKDPEVAGRVKAGIQVRATQERRLTHWEIDQHCCRPRGGFRVLPDSLLKP